MEKKFYIGVGLLIFLLVFGFFVGFWVQKQQESIRNTVVAAQLATENDNMEEGLRLITQAQNRWQRIWKGMAAVSHHITLEEIDRIFAQLFACRDDTEFILHSAELSSLLDALINDHVLSWWNLL